MTDWSTRWRWTAIWVQDSNHWEAVSKQEHVEWTMFVYLGNSSKIPLRLSWEDCAVRDSESDFETGHQEWSKSDCYRGSAQIHSAMQTIH